MSIVLSPLLVWIITGILMLIGEMLTTSFFLLFMSLGSFAAALAAFFQQGILIQVVLFLIVSVLGVLLLRKPIQNKLLKKALIASDVGSQVVVTKQFAPNQQDTLMYQGTSWSAQNVGSSTIQNGSTAVIVSIDGNKLLIKNEK